MYYYKLVRQIFFRKNIGIYISYGIECHRKGILITAVPDISTDKAFVHRLAELLTAEQCEPLHLSDVIEDFMP